MHPVTDVLTVSFRRERNLKKTLMLADEERCGEWQWWQKRRLEES